MLVGIEAIHCISEEYIWHTSLDRRLEKCLKEIFRFYDFIELEFRIFLGISVEYLEVSIEGILYAATVDIIDLVWIHERPVSIFFDTTHEEIWYSDRRKEIECLGSDITTLCLHIEKVEYITMPDIEGH